MKAWVRSSLATALRALDLQIHREILRLRVSYQLSLDEFRGLYISDQQVDALIRDISQQDEAYVDIVELNQRIVKQQARALEALSQDQRWQALCRQLNLNSVEQFLVLAVLAPELDAKYEVLYAYLNNDVTRKYPTVDLLLRLALEKDIPQCRQALSKHENLLRQGFLECFTQGANSQRSNYGLHDGVKLSAIVSDFLLDDHLASSTLDGKLISVEHSFIDWPALPFSVKLLTQFNQLGLQLQARAQPLKLVIEADKQSAAEFLAANLYKQQGMCTLKLNMMELPIDKLQLKQQLQQLNQFLQLHQHMLIINFYELDKLDHSHIALTASELAASFCKGVSHCVFIVDADSSHHALLTAQVDPQRPLHRFVLPALDIETRYSLWNFLLALHQVPVAADTVDHIANTFKLDFKQINTIIEQLKVSLAFAKEADTPEPSIDKQQLFDLAKQQSYTEIGTLAEKVKHQFYFEDLILPAEILNRIKEVIFAIRNRKLVYEEWGFGQRLGGAKGIMALFAGSSGTGKTMAASVIASELGLDIYRIDLSKVVSKYIGDTEKNLDKIFTTAKQANCILFFDEADALFGKRSEVKDAHDRYANVEVAYLLQKMEDHDGIVLMTTNLSKNIDQAFSRRLQYIIDFPRPDEQHRELIWKRMFNDKAPLAADVDFNFLARQFTNTGGDIKNIVIDAAMMAAATTKQEIDMPLLLRASARQMVKQGKVPSASEFKHYFELVNTQR